MTVSVPNDHRVSGIISPLEANDCIGKLGQKIDDLSFALIPPLHSDHNDIGHRSFRTFSPPRTRRTQKNLEWVNNKTIHLCWISFNRSAPSVSGHGIITAGIRIDFAPLRRSALSAISAVNGFSTGQFPAASTSIAARTPLPISTA